MKLLNFFPTLNIAIIENQSFRHIKFITTFDVALFKFQNNTYFEYNTFSLYCCNISKCVNFDFRINNRVFRTTKIVRCQIVSTRPKFMEGPLITGIAFTCQNTLILNPVCLLVQFLKIFIPYVHNLYFVFKTALRSRQRYLTGGKFFAIPIVLDHNVFKL